MAITKYTYSILTDTLNAKVNVDILSKEIKDSSITISEDHIIMFGDVLDIYMKDELSVAQENTLDAIVTNHDGSVILNDPMKVDLISKTTNNIPKVAVYEPEGYSKAHVSHDFTDPCTWYADSVEVTGETLSGSGTGPYTSANVNWIDLTHGRHTREDEISSNYTVTIYDNGTAKLEDTDYTVNYEAGTVTFTSVPSGPVTADYHYENGSTYKLIPNSGKVLRLEHAELDFSVDVVMSTVHFEVWAYNPYDLPNKVMVDRVSYKNEKDILCIANTVEEISAWGSLTNAVKRVEFDYGRTIDLKSSLGMELRIRIDSETPFTITNSSSFGTVTFYTAEEDE